MTTALLQNVDDFTRLWTQGYRTIVPVIPPGATLSEHSVVARRLAKGKDSRGKTPGICTDGKWRSFYWNGDRQPTEADMARYAAMGAGLGLVCTPGSRLVGIDVDCLDKDRARFVLRELQARFPFVGVQVPLRFGQKPKFLVPLRVAGDDEITYRRVEIKCDDGRQERVELLCAGRYFNLLAVHPGTLRPYELTGDLPSFEDLPQVGLVELDGFFRDLAAKLPNALFVAGKKTKANTLPVNVERLKGLPEAVRKALSALPNTAHLFPHYDDYIAIGYAIKGASQDWPEDGEDLFLEWAEQWDNGSNQHAQTDWQTLNNPRVGIGWLNDKVLELTGRPALLDPITDTSPPPITSVSPLALIPFAEVARGALALGNVPLIKGLLDCGAASMLYAPSNAGKTFVAMDIAMHVALGLPWNGMRVRRCAVVYLAMEGGNGVRRRAEALRRRFGLDEDAHVPFYFRLVPLDLLRADGDVRPLIAAVTGIADLGLVVVDTTSRALAGGDENSSVDMGAYVRNMDAIRTATDAHVMNVHHTGKDAARGARGWSGMRAAIDTELEIEDRTFTATKQRDLEMNVSLAFTLEPVRLGTDADGDAIVSCVVRWLQAGETPAQAVEKPVGEPTLAEVPVLQAVGEAAELAPNAACSASMDEILDRVLKSGGKMTYEGLRTHLRRLLDKGLVRRKGRGRWDVAPVRAAIAPDDVFG